MQYYQEITLLPDAETSRSFLWTKVFTQLHIAFADWKNRHGAMDFAVSFPEYGAETLGSKIRLMAETEEALTAFDAGRVLARLSDYVHLTRVRPIPARRVRGWAIYSRWQEEGALPSRARRYARRHADVSYEKALRLLDKGKPKTVPPYVWMKSFTSGQVFRLFIKKDEAQEDGRGVIGTYGLSHGYAVPEF